MWLCSCVVGPLTGVIPLNIRYFFCRWVRSSCHRLVDKSERLHPPFCLGEIIDTLNTILDDYTTTPLHNLPRPPAGISVSIRTKALA
jgi:hypothetical protein